MNNSLNNSPKLAKIIILKSKRISNFDSFLIKDLCSKIEFSINDGDCISLPSASYHIIMINKNGKNICSKTVLIEFKENQGNILLFTKPYSLISNFAMFISALLTRQVHDYYGYGGVIILFSVLIIPAVLVSQKINCSKYSFSTKEATSANLKTTV